MAKLALVDRSSTSMADITPLRTRTNEEEEFSAFLVEIADKITKEEVRQMKFLCSELRGRLDEIEEPREFVNFLRQSGIISPGDIDFLIWLLDTIGNKRLANMIRERGKKIIQGILSREHSTVLAVPAECFVVLIEQSHI